jgi:hypothetical protein
MALEKVQVDDGLLDVLVAQQQLNGAQIGAGIQQMGGIGAAETVWADSRLNAGSLDRAVACMPHCFRPERGISPLAGNLMGSRPGE